MLKVVGNFFVGPNSHSTFAWEAEKEFFSPSVPIPSLFVHYILPAHCQTVTMGRQGCGLRLLLRNGKFTNSELSKLLPQMTRTGPLPVYNDEEEVVTVMRV